MSAARGAGPLADWTTAGTYQVASCVYRIPLPLPGDGLRAVNVYAIDHGDSLTLTRRERKLEDLDPFNQMLAVTETVAHLVVLVAQGRLRQTRLDGVDHYHA